MHEGEVVDALGQMVRQSDDDREDHRGSSHDRRSDEDGLGGRLEGVAGPVVVLKQVLGPFPARGDAEITAQLVVDASQILDA